MSFEDRFVNPGQKILLETPNGLGSAQNRLLDSTGIEFYQRAIAFLDFDNPVLDSHAADCTERNPKSQPPNPKFPNSLDLTLNTQNSTLSTHRMETGSAIAQIRQVCISIGAELMRIHPAIPALGNKDVQDELYKTVFEITKQVEVIKKRLAKLETGSETPEL
jgi:hypothetical protein